MKQPWWKANLFSKATCPECGKTSNKGGMANHIKRCGKPDVEFWNKVNKTNGCWLFTGAINKSGYGTLCRKGKMKSAHRTAWEYTRGEIPHGMFVLHKCDVRNCVNPDHLWLGTNKDNLLDMAKKGRKWDPTKPILHPHLSKRLSTI